VEAKWTTSRSRFADGLPQDYEAQVRWQMGVTGYPRADVAALVGGDTLEVFEVVHDADLFADLVDIATDFRARLAAGGPFSRDHARIKRDHPADDGSEMAADEELAEAVSALVALRAQRKDMEAAEDDIEAAIKARMGDAAVLTGPGFRITWKRTKDVEQTDWRSVADGLLRQLPETERTALVGIHTSVKPGFRPFRVMLEKE
jgi:predicted phage-related endonuclease